MTKKPRLPHKLEWDGRTAARAARVEYLAGIGVSGYARLKDVTADEAHGSAADGAGARSMPEDLKGAGSDGVSMEKPRSGAYYRYIKPKDTAHGES